MLDLVEENIARKLADRHLYPFAVNIYLDVFRAFSHFPLKLKDLDIPGPGDTITFMALVVRTCLQNHSTSFQELFESVYTLLEKQARQFMVQTPKVETFLGCILYFYHPSQIKGALNTIGVKGIFSADELYEYNLKKETVLIHIL